MSSIKKIGYPLIGLFIVVIAFFIVSARKIEENKGQIPSIDNQTQNQNSLSSEESISFPEGSIAVVFINQDGFNPTTIEVVTGTTVRFINQTEDPMRVASDPYPINIDLPDFDSQAKIQVKDDYYEYTFSKTGSWGYHNQNAPNQKGKIIVN